MQEAGNISDNHKSKVEKRDKEQEYLFGAPNQYYYITIKMQDRLKFI